MPPSFSMTIAGHAASSKAEFPVRNPATAEIYAQAPECTKQQLDNAMSAAQDAFQDWRLDSDKRRDLLLDCAREIRQHADELARLLTVEQGKPLRNARSEVD